MNIDSPTVPEAIRRLPRDERGFPIPFAQFRDDDGKADFRVLDVARSDRCVDERLCGVCGEPLGYWIVFIGGPGSIKSRAFKDPAMHPACAAFVALACPFVGRASYRYSTAPPPAGPNLIATIDPRMEHHTQRPEQMFLATTRSYRRHGRGPAMYIKAAPFSSVDQVDVTVEHFEPARCPVTHPSAAAEARP